MTDFCSPFSSTAASPAGGPWSSSPTASTRTAVPAPSSPASSRSGWACRSTSSSWTTPAREPPAPPPFAATRQRLRRIAEETGGRLFHLELHGGTRWWAEPIEQVFEQIEEDLRHQHVLTYYTDQPRGAPVEPEIRVTRRGLRLRSAVPLPGIE